MSIPSYGSTQRLGLEDEYLETIMDVKQINGHAGASTMSSQPNFGIPCEYPPFYRPFPRHFCTAFRSACPFLPVEKGLALVAFTKYRFQSIDCPSKSGHICYLETSFSQSNMSRIISSYVVAVVVN